MCGHNRLCYLPGSIKRLHLDSIDLASNSFESMINMRNANNLGVPSLVECAARKVINCRYVLNALAIGVEHFRFPKDMLWVLMLLVQLLDVAGASLYKFCMSS